MRPRSRIRWSKATTKGGARKRRRPGGHIPGTARQAQTDWITGQNHYAGTEGERQSWQHVITAE